MGKMTMGATTKPPRSSERPEYAVKARLHHLVKKWDGPPIQSHFKVFGEDGATWQQRKGLRQALVASLPPSPSLPSLLQPGRRPHLPGIPISISHCPLMGGFIFSVGAGTGLGLDVEQDDRVGWRIVARVSAKTEREKTPRPSLLWTAKEAAVKNLPPGVTLPRTTISHWHRLPSPGGYGFSFHNGEHRMAGRGVAFHLENLAVACARVEKKTFSALFS